jgi:hypothetical protein
VKERPILFNGPMVRAIIEGRKTQTRRIIKPQPQLIESSGRWYWKKALDVHGQPLVDASRYWWEYYGTSSYGKSGDRLWVRETFAIEHQVDHDQKPPFNDGRPVQTIDEFGWRQPHYRATDPTPELEYEDGNEEPGVRWKPSIHMPRWASRIDLEVIGVRVERLQDISEDDCIAEGIAISQSGTICAEFGMGRRLYRQLWESINNAGSWDKNPWVWVIEFKRMAP